MEEYKFHTIKSRKGDYGWQKQICQEVNIFHKLFPLMTVSAPEGFGKTTCAVQMLINHLHAENAIFPFSHAAKVKRLSTLFVNGDPVNSHISMTRIFREFGDDVTVNGDGSVSIGKPQNGKRVYSASDPWDAVHILETNPQLDIIIVDDADRFQAKTLNRIVNYDYFHDIGIVLFGSSKAGRREKLEKDLWSHFQNHPCFKSFQIVQDIETKKNEKQPPKKDVETVQEYLEKLHDEIIVRSIEGIFSKKPVFPIPGFSRAKGGSW